MDVKSDDREWHDSVVKEVEDRKQHLSPNDERKYKVKILLRVAKRTAMLSGTCKDCKKHQKDVMSLANMLGVVKQEPGKRSEYITRLYSLIEHLRVVHSLAAPGQKTALYLNIYTAIGIAAGFTFGVWQQNLTIWLIGGISFGIVFGVIFGSLMERLAEKDDKVI